MATADCRLAQPQELAERGPAEQVFDLASASLSSQQALAIVGYAVSALAAMVIGLPLLICAFRPFGTNAPPPLVCLGVGSFALSFAVALAYVAFRHGVADRRAAAAYHLFRDGLAIVGPGQEQRWVAWEQIGTAHAAWGEKKLYFESLQQVGEAVRLLEDLLGRDFRPEAARLASCV